MKKIIVFLLLSICSINIGAQQNDIADYIQNKSTIREGGCDIFKYKGNTYVVCVVSVSVQGQSLSTVQRIGEVKAKRDLLAFINGSDITSYTEIKTTESSRYDSKGTNQVEVTEDFVEYIREEVQGSINQCARLGGWYSANQQTYFLAIYKQI